MNYPDLMKPRVYKLQRKVKCYCWGGCGKIKWCYYQVTEFKQTYEGTERNSYPYCHECGYGYYAGQQQEERELEKQYNKTP